MTFYGTMILEGMIAMIWAAAAMGTSIIQALQQEQQPAVGEVAKGLLGPVGGIIAILGVIVLPITSGDTALRSCRLMIADYIHYDQRKKKNRVILTICMFVPVIAILVFAKLNAEGFNILWRYFAWSNQTIAVFAFAAITVYLMAKKRFSKMGIPCTACSGKFLYVRNFFLYLKCKDRIRTFNECSIHHCSHSDSGLCSWCIYAWQKIRCKTYRRIIKTEYEK